MSLYDEDMQEEAEAEAYERGLEDGYSDATRDPVGLINDIEEQDRQAYFDRFKTEAARLGVTTDEH